LDTKDYILVFLQNEIHDKCDKCDKQFAFNYWCKPCQINDSGKSSINWTSGNEKIDNLIQEMQSNICNYDIIIEWIPYDQFSNVEELMKDGLTTIYKAIWKNGPFHYDNFTREYSRQQNNIVNLKLFNNSQNITNEFLNEV
jgi:hypothetical protein